MFLLWLPISLQAQLVLSLAILGLMLLFMMRPQNKTFRLMTFVFSAVLALRYAFWRTTETLPDIHEPLNFIPGIILYAAEMYCLVMLAINFFIVADPLQRKPANLPDNPARWYGQGGEGYTDYPTMAEQQAASAEAVPAS